MAYKVKGKLQVGTMIIDDQDGVTDQVLTRDSSGVVKLKTPQALASGIYPQVIDQIQLSDPANGTILSAIVVGVSVAPNNPINNQTLSVTDGTTTEIYTFKTSPSGAFDVQIGAAVNNTNDNFAAVINAQSAVWGGRSGPESDYCIIYRKAYDPTAQDRTFGSAGTYIDMNINGYELNATTLQPATDQGVKTFGYTARVPEGSMVPVFRTCQLRMYTHDPQLGQQQWRTLPFQQLGTTRFTEFVKKGWLETGCYYWITEMTNGNYTPNGVLLLATSPTTFSEKAIGGFMEPNWVGLNSDQYFGVKSNFSNVPVETGFGSFLGEWTAALTPSTSDMVSYQNIYYLNRTGVNTGTSPASDLTNWKSIWDTNFIWYKGFESAGINNQVVMWPDADGWSYYGVKDKTAFNNTNPIANSAAYVKLTKIITNGYLEIWDKIDVSYQGSFVQILAREDRFGQRIEDFSFSGSHIPFWIFNSASYIGNKVINGVATLALYDAAGDGFSSGISLQGCIFEKDSNISIINSCNLIGITAKSNSTIDLGHASATNNIFQYGTIGAGTSLKDGTALNSSTVGNFELGNSLGVIEIQEGILDFVVNLKGSTARHAMSASGSFSAGVITLPTGYDYIGIFEFSDAAGGNISNILNPPTLFPFKCVNSTSVTNSYAPVSLGSANPNDIISDAGNFTLDTLGLSTDFVEFELVQGFIRKNNTGIMA